MSIIKSVQVSTDYMIWNYFELRKLSKLRNLNKIFGCTKSNQILEKNTVKNIL